MAVLEGRDIEKSFQEGQHTLTVLRGVSLAVERGEVVALEGPSGSGKTTLLSILGCILTPSSGTVLVDGQEVTSRNLVATRKKSIGFVFQQYNLFPALDALENVQFALEVRGVPNARAEAMRALEAVDLAKKMRTHPLDLSGGQKQRVAIARAIAGKPPVLLADEPTANLDSAVGMQVLELVKRLAREENSGVLVVTHDPKVRKVADRVLRIEDGRLAEPVLAGGVSC